MATENAWSARAMAACAVVLWSAAYVWGKTLLTWIQPLGAGLVRYVVAAFILIAIALIVGRPGAALRIHWRAYLLLGFIGIACYQAFLFTAIAYTSITNVAIFMALTPLITQVAARFFLGESLNVRTIVGLLIAIAGALLATLGSTAARHSGFSVNPGDALAFGAACCMAFYSIGAKKIMPSGVSPIVNTALTLTCGAVCLLPVTLVIDMPHSLPSSSVVVALAGLAVGSTVIGYLCWTRATQTIGVREPNIYLNFIPVLTMAMAAMQGDALGHEQMLGAALVIIGASASLLKKRQPRAVTAQAIIRSDRAPT